MSTIATLNPTLYAEIQAIANAPEGVHQDYSGMYNAIAQGIRDGSIAVPGGANSSIYFWYSKAGAVNANDTSDPAAVFIRTVATRGLARDGKSADLNTVSDSIAKNIARQIVDGNGLPDFTTQLSNDIGTSLAVGGITLGGWGGSFYHWNDIYRDPITREEKTVGDWIMSKPGELDKFIDVNSKAIADVAQQFPALPGNGGFLDSIAKVFENMGKEALSLKTDAGQAYARVIIAAAAELNDRGWDLISDLLYREFVEDSAGINDIDYDINGNVSGNYRTGVSTRPAAPRDPLAIDLDGDGIETVGVGTSPVLFDHNADGIKTGTGWVKGDDGWLVLDRNNNGLIDSGRELFGVDTLLSGTVGVDATYASTGFAALKTLDSNGDNLFDANDTAFGQVRIWQDSNQDGISQGTELFTLAQKNIASIGLNASTTTQNLGNGNTVSGTATVTRTNGTTTLAETVSVAGDTTAANLFLGVNPFYREFTTPIAPTTLAQGLPEMRGSGWVRDLREAMSLGTPQGDALAAAVQNFANATTKDAQMALLDDVLRLWADSNQAHALPTADDPTRRFVLTGDAATSAKLQAYIPVLEVFNGMNVADSGMQAPTVSNGVSTYNVFANQAPILLQAYESLRESVYGALVVQTRLKPYLDAVELVIDESGVQFDTSGVLALASTKANQDAYNTVLDLLELRKYANTSAQAVGLEVYKTLKNVLNNITVTPDVQALLATERIASLGLTGTTYSASNAGEIVWGNTNNNLITGGNGADQLFGFEGNDTLTAVGGGDTLDGGDGDDAMSNSTTLYGGTGTTFMGGKGNDTMSGNMASDTYVFNLGDGQDTINEFSNQYYSHTDVLTFGPGILPSAVTPTRSGVHLVLKVGTGGDQITVNNWFADSGSFYQIEQIKFADGTTWSNSQVSTRALEVFGTEGADTLSGVGAFYDVLRGGAGNDTLTAVGGGDTLDGGDGDDAMSNSTTLYGGTGTTFMGGKGNDTMSGNMASDTYVFNLGDGQDTINEFSNQYYSHTDVLTFGPGILPSAVTPTRSGVHLVLKVGTGGDQITVNNWFADSGSFYQIEQIKFADGTTWSNSQVSTRALEVFGTEGADTLSGVGAFYDVLRGGAGNDTLTAVGGGDTLDGGDGDDAMSNSTTLYGGTGTTFMGGKGNDTMSGNMASDTYVFNLGDGQDTINEFSNQYYSHTDVLTFGPGILPAAVTPTRSGVHLVLKVGTGGDQITVNNWFSSTTYQIEAIQFADGTTWSSSRIADAVTTDLIGTTAADSLTGTAGSDNILGLEGNDTLNGGAGHDRFDGGLGNDVLVGGLGDDTYIVDSTKDTVTENANEGLDTVVSSVAWTLGANLENLSLSGTAAINGTGNAFNNSLVGNSAANTLNGGAGSDFMVGLGGNDIYVVDDVNDRIVENLNEGTDTVQSSITWTLGANLEKLTLTGTAAVNGTGNELNNSLLGNSANNTLIGGAGNDTLNGGAGADTLIGGVGADTYVVDNVGDAVAEAANEGTDTVQSSITWTLGANLEKLTLTGSAAIHGTGNELANTLTGNSGANTLTGGAGNDTLNGGAGADTLIGGTGDDTYVVDNAGDVITEALNEGTDTVQSSITWTLGSNLENLTLTGTAAVNGSGNTLNNVLVGNSASNTLSGGAGNDTLNGGAGADTLVGGLGDDIYVVDNTADIVTEAINEGVDLVQSSITWTLGSNLENLTLTGSAVINATGNELDNILLGNSANNTLTGGAGNDTLDGGAGSDTLVGGAGNDTYVVNVATDVVTELAAEGFDTVRSSVTLFLGANLENLILTGTSAINGTGNELDNVLTGNSGNNTLNGDTGSDILDGGAGNDTMVGGIGNDTYQFGRGYASDVIQENDSTSGNTDVLQFLSGIASDQLWFKKISNNLEVSIIGTSDKATLTNWYLGNQYHVEQFKTSDGETLLDSQVQNLVSAMAAFSPPTAGQTTLPANYASSLAPVIAANWQ
ncbi:calcium-binding protein [Rhodoferax sp.]|uniref:calcium-binding protein n=1 Tax=Rhodoferax sp. TaxID=50421 RepID=UPI002ACD2A6D|nr:calcium-binding protein [Rhodoferax sp.]MDZ7922274.1 calcium-binding protein [Rhodoferax sp.]